MNLDDLIDALCYMSELEHNKPVLRIRTTKANRAVVIDYADVRYYIEDGVLYRMDEDGNLYEIHTAFDDAGIAMRESAGLDY